jgi:3-methyladenine DNA glycosylase AlkD
MITEVKVDIAAELKALGDPVRAKGERAYLKSELEHYGVPVPEVRKVVRTVPVAGHEELLGLVQELWGPVHELRTAAIELLIRHVRLLEATDLGVPERLIRTSATWAYVDALAVRVTGALIMRHPFLAAALDGYVTDGNFWIRRTALLALLPGIRTGDGDLARLSRYGDLLLGEKEFFIRKALGWVLRELSKTDPAWVISWVEPRAARLSGTTIREAVRRLPADDAARLMALYRP